MDSTPKAKKSRKPEALNTVLLTPPASADASASESVPKNKKRKRNPEDGPLAQVADTNGAAIEKKKKKKKHTSESLDTLELPNPNATTINASLVEKLSKKERKKLKREKNGDAVVHPPTPSELDTPKVPAATAAEADAFLKENAIRIDSPNTPIIPTLSFDQLDIEPRLREALASFKKPTPIQSCAWPALLMGHDVIGIAETGSGKTMAFGLPALAHLTKTGQSNAKKGKNISVLVVAPTRELAIQTFETMEVIGGPFGIKSVCVFGGVDKGPQKKLLSTPNVRVVVGTPGRLLDLANEGACDLSGVSYLVLDEADRMLDRGFENDIRNIISQTSDGASRQTLMFSATWPESVRRLASSFLRSPVRITVGSDDLTANSRVVQSVEVFDDPHSKDKRLHQLLKTLKHATTNNPEDSRILVFVLYKKEADRVLDTLKYIGYSAGAIHGDMGQAQRIKSLEEFKSGKTGLLVATDVAARGLDIPNVAAVINYSFPLTIEDYIHRIGRTGRGGKDGKSFTFFTGDKHERSLAGELARVLRESGFDAEPLKKFPMTLKKKEHGAYGAFFRDDLDGKKATKIKF